MFNDQHVVGCWRGTSSVVLREGSSGGSQTSKDLAHHQHGQGSSGGTPTSKPWSTNLVGCVGYNQKLRNADLCKFWTTKRGSELRKENREWMK